MFFDFEVFLFCRATVLHVIWSSKSIFFFKQKTAYEMRISDWSSDVCSSDLLAAERPGDPFGGHIGDHETLDEEGEGQPLGEEDGCQIGRAACRERVCQYV